MMMDDSCATCGTGRRIAEATFDLERGQVHWAMWSCGHAERAFVDASPAAPIPAIAG
jgi:hypothetical protein